MRFRQSLELDLPDGRSLEVTARSALNGRPFQIHPIARIEARCFDMCPICGAPATDDEDVPPASIGGRVMTRTCQPCNNGLGSRVEADLADWHDGALTLTRFMAEGVPGRRRSSRLLYRTTPNGEFVLIPDGGVDPGVIEMLESGQVDLSACLPDLNRSRIGLMKHAFLAACLRFGELEGPGPDAVRADLLAARDAGSRAAVPRSDLALGLTVLRSSGGPELDWPVVHAVADIEDQEDPCHGVVLGGTTFVSWSSEPDDAPYDVAPVLLTLTVGDRVGGVIAAVDGRTAGS